jgi:lysophospholipid acyltransferase (LPLAT)-like uncharacterized protein
VNQLLARLLAAAVRLLAITWRIETDGADKLERLRMARQGFVFALWHRALIPLLWHHRGEGITLLVSEHADGGLLAEVAQRWGYRVVRGSSTRGGSRGFRQLVQALVAGWEVAITPDGPRGPAGVTKRGVVAAARRTGRSVLPVGAIAQRAWRIGSWDRLLVPRPFARVRVSYSDPESVPEDDSLEAVGRRLASRLDAVTCPQEAA